MQIYENTLKNVTCAEPVPFFYLKFYTGGGGGGGGRLSLE